MRHTRRIAFLLIAALPVLACQAAMRLIPGKFQPPLSTPTQSLSISTTSAATSCPVETGMILRAANTESLPPGRFPFVNTSVNLDIPLVTYMVNGDELQDPVLEQIPQDLQKYQKDFATQKNAWQLFTALIPKDQRMILNHFQIMTDGPGGVLSAVEQSRDDPHRWILEADIADIPDSKNLAFTLLHEFGHLLTLGPSQVPPNLQVFKNPHSTRLRDRAIAACPSYFTGEGCSLPTSYINLFFDRFWKDVYQEWSAIDRMEDDGRKDIKLDAFYRKYRDHFVDSYAVTSPVEDIAETWAFFVLAPRPVGTSEADQKLRFFYGYPELVNLRATVLGNLCTANP
jgi:hypothetical protein